MMFLSREIDKKSCQITQIVKRKDIRFSDKRNRNLCESKLLLTIKR